MDDLISFIKHVLDALSFATVIGALTQLLPPIAALMSIVWLGMQMYDRYKRQQNKEDAP